MSLAKGYGSKIRAIRQKLGLSQEQFGAMIGSVQATVSRWEKEQWEPKGWHLAVISLMATGKPKNMEQYFLKKGPIKTLGQLLIGSEKTT